LPNSILRPAPSLPPVSPGLDQYLASPFAIYTDDLGEKAIAKAMAGKP
jgi:hypothetical protein